MRVLIDRHHHALFEAYHLTLADRFGWDLYAPYGMEWFDEGIWQFEKQFHGDAVARQYLDGVWHSGPDLEIDKNYRPGIWAAPDTRHPRRILRGVTLEAARAMRWDLVISSLPHNDEGYHRFAQEVGAHFGVQVGNNVQQSRWDLAEFVWSSSTLPGYGPEWVGKSFEYMGAPAVMTHQEFSTDIFRPEWPPANRREVASWVNCFGEGPSYPDFLRFAQAYAGEFDFKVYGALGSHDGDEFQAGDVSWVPDVADRMREARVGWHTKHWSDGFGHTIHNWASIGRPIVGYHRYYRDKIASPLWDEGYTSFDIEGLAPDALADILRLLRDDDEVHQRMSENMAARFREVVDFDHEATIVRSLLESVA